MRSCLQILLRQAHAQIPRPGRREGLRAGDRRQGERAGAAAGGVGAVELATGAGRAGHQHRPVPVGREPLPDDARDPRGAGAGRHARLGPDQVPPGDSRPRDLRADGEAAAGLGQPLGADPRRGGLESDRATHAQPSGPPRRRRRAAPARHRLRRADRPADAGHQRQSRADTADRRPCPRRRRLLPRRRRPPPARRGQGRLLRLAKGQTPGPPHPLRKAVSRPPRLPPPFRAPKAHAQSPRLGARQKQRSFGGGCGSPLN